MGNPVAAEMGARSVYKPLPHTNYTQSGSHVTNNGTVLNDLGRTNQR